MTTGDSMVNHVSQVTTVGLYSPNLVRSIYSSIFCQMGMDIDLKTAENKHHHRFRRPLIINKTYS